MPSKMLERKSLASKLKANLKGINVKIDYNENSNNNQINYYSENITQNNQEKEIEKIIINSPKIDDELQEIEEKDVHKVK
jgi:hypothetical protein